MLVQQREQWWEQFRNGIVPVLYKNTSTCQNELVNQLKDYINKGIIPTHVDFHRYLQYRNTNKIRYSIIIEQLMEYAIFSQECGRGGSSD